MLQPFNRATSLPVTDSTLRRSLDGVSANILGPCLKSRRMSMDLTRASGTDYMPSTVRAERAGVTLEVGRGVDLNEQRQRLERNWNTDQCPVWEKVWLVRSTCYDPGGNEKFCNSLLFANYCCCCVCIQQWCWAQSLVKSYRPVWCLGFFQIVLRCELAIRNITMLAMLCWGPAGLYNGVQNTRPYFLPWMFHGALGKLSTHTIT